MRIFTLKGFATLIITLVVSAQSYGQATCASAIVISSIPFNATGLTTCGEGDDYNNGDLCGSAYMNGDDYVFEYTPTANTTASVSLTGTDTWTGVFVTSGCPDAGGTCEMSATNSGGNPGGQVNFVAGTTYYIIVSTYPNPQCTPFDISINEVNAVDACEDAIDATDGQTYFTSNIGSTADHCLCSGSTEANVWFQWTAPCNWPVGDTSYVNLYNQGCNTTAGMQMSVMDYDCSGIDCQMSGPGYLNAAGCVLTFNSQTTDDIYGEWVPVACQTYWFNLDGYGGSQCTFAFQVNDNPCQTGTNITTVDASCGSNDGSAEVTIVAGDGPFTFEWKDDLGNTIQTTNNSSGPDAITGLGAGTYYVEITNANGCLATLEVVISQGGTSAAGFTVNDQTQCLTGNSFDFTNAGSTGGGVTYDWTFPSGTPSSSTSENPSGVTWSTPGTYTIQQDVDDGGGCVAVYTLDITVYAEPTLTMTQAPVTCNGLCDGGASVSESGEGSPYTYLWSNGGTSSSITNVCTSNYTVTVSTSGGCDVISSISVTEPSSVVVSSVETSVTCISASTGESALTVRGGTTSYSYLWDANANNQTSPAATGLSANNYTVTVTDGNSCASILSVTIIEPTPLVVPSTVTDASCGASNGSIEITVSGGTTSYSYLWSNGQNTSLATGLATGTYIVTITDGNSCVTTITENVSNTSFSLSITSQTDVLCNGYSTGSATVSEIGGATPFTYLWSDGQTAPSATGLMAGVQTVTVTDNTPCSAVISTTITEPSAIVISSSETAVDCNGGSDGESTLTVTGGTTSYTYLWDANANNQITGTATGLFANTYSVTVTDANSCPALYTITITEPATALSVATTCTDATTVGGADGASASSATGGVTPYGYSWNNGQNTATVTGLSTGNQTVTATDANGCTATSTCTVSEPICALAITLTPTDISCNGISDGAISLLTTGGFSPLTYNWSSGSSSQNLSGLTQNTYSVTITDNALCSITATAVVAEPAILSASTTCTDVSAFGASDGASDIGATGGTTLYQYLWSNGITIASNTGLTVGIYVVTITDANNCTTTSSCVVSDPGCILTASASPTDISCYGANDGIATVTVSSGLTPYTYAWNDGALQTTAGASGLSPGVYAITVIDANSCITGTTTTVTEPAVLAISSTVTDAACGVNNGQIATSPTGGTTAYSYNWSDGQTSPTATGLGLGTYTLTVTDINSCTVIINEPINNPTPNLTITSTTGVSCFGGSDGVAIVAASGGNTPYIYLWSNGETNDKATDFFVGVVSVTVTDQTPCTAIISATITGPTDITLTSVETSVTCGGDADGTSTVSASGGASSYSYNWPASVGGQATAQATGLSGGIYVVTVTDGSSCSKYLSVTIVEPSTVAATAVTANVSCFGNSDGYIAISVAGGTTPYSFLWSTTATTQSLTGLSIGSYTLTTTDNVGCSTTNSFTITEPTALVFFTSLTPVSCPSGSDGTASVSVSGGVSPYSYLWDNGATTSSISGLPAGVVLVSVSDDNNCSAKTFPTSCIEITRILVDACNTPENQHEMFFFETGPNPLDAANLTVTWPFNSWNLLCSNPTFITNTNATIVGGGILIDPPGGIIPAGANVLLVSGDGPTTTSNSFVNLTDTVYVLFQCDQGGTSGHFKNYDVAGGSRTLSIDFGGGCTDVVSYDIDSLTMQDGTLGQENGATVSFTYSGIDTYTNDGCVAPFDPPVSSIDTIITLTIVEIPGMVLVMDSTTVVCSGNSDGTATVTITGGATPYDYVWDTNAADQTTSTATGLTAQSYSVTTTDGNGCAVIGNITVTEPLALAVSTTTTQASCGASDGTATASTTGGTGTNYTYLWSGGQTTATATGFLAGSYTVLVLDESSCPQTVTITINSPSPALSFTDSTMITCFGGSNGAATVSATGGATPYTYNWASGSTSTFSTGLTTGVQSVTVTDNLNCVAFASIDIIEPPQLLLTVDSTEALCFGQNNGTAIANAAGGATPYIYMWDAATGNQTTAVATSLKVGSYSITVTDDSLCTVSDVISVTEPSALSVTSVVVDENCNLNDGSISVNTTGGTSPYVYLWASGETATTVTGLAAGSYSLTVSDANGCNSPQTITIGTIGGITLTVAGTDAVCNAGPTGSAVSNITGTSTPFAYNWANGNTAASITGLLAGTYSLTVTDAVGCMDSATVVIGQPSVITTTITSGPASCLNNDGTASVSTAGTGYSYLWSNGETTAVASGLSSGTYFVSVIDGAGCQVIASTNVEESSVVVADFSYTQNQDMVPSEFVFTNLSTNALVYSWVFGNGETSTETNPTTTYNESGEYEITLYAYADSSMNCFDSITVSMELFGNSSLIIPIVFSPNDDGINDLYRVEAQFIETFKATILNRWGTELYSWDRVNSTWDGRTYSGVIVPDGTYFILVEAVGIDGVEYSAQKSVTLLRQ